MPIKAILDTLDGLDEHVAALYTAEGGSFVLDIEAIDAHPKVRALATANRTNIAKRDEFKRKYEEAEVKLGALPEDFDAETWARLKAEDDPSKRGKSEEALQLKQVYETRFAAQERKHATELAAKDQAMAEKDAHIERLMLDEGLTKALVDNGVDKDLMEAASALLRRSAKVVSEDGKLRAVFDTDLGEEPIDAYVKNWVQSPKGQRFRAQADGPGANGGSKTTTTKNPFDKKSFNLTEAQALTQSDPARARELAKAAGHPVTW